jgi:CDP-2,3-bis-(O-geranylgeranyl)-sn-glycerol synthase
LGLNLYLLFIYPIIYIWPAYVANGAPVIFGGGKPLDFNKKIGGKPIFGNHKTIRGLVAGLLAGFFMAFLESRFIPYMLLVGILLTIGTMFGDLVGSFVKRRIGKKEGAQMLLLDQYPFLIFALLFAYPLGNMPGLFGIIFLVVLTGVLHVLTNHSAHKMKLKKVPW